MAFNIPIPSHSIYSIPIPSRPIPNFLTHSHSHGIPECAIPIPSRSHSHTRSGTVVYNYCSLLYGCYIVIDTVQKSWSFIITVLKTFSIGFTFIIQIQAHGTFSVVNYAKRKRTPRSKKKLWE